MIDAGDAPIAASYEWRLDAQWRTRSVHLHVYEQNERELHLERCGESSWRVDELSIAPSRQRYERLDAQVFKYIDLGVYQGFEARLSLDAAGLVRSYQGLFEWLDAPAT